MNILISGPNGFIGSPLTEKLKQSGHEVYFLTRNKTDQPNSFYWKPTEGIIELDEAIPFDTVIHLAGEGIANRRWTDSQKKKIKESRVLGTKLLSEKIAQLEHKPALLISASATGYYGDRADEDLTESSAPGESYLADVCNKWEKSTEAAGSAGIRVVQTRFGIVLGLKGGALKKMLLPFKMGVGGIIGNGKQFWSWIALEDVIEIILFIMENDSLSGAVNCVSPQPVTNYEFTKVLGKVLHRPTFFPMPGFIAKAALGEMADALLLCSAKVHPEKLLAANYPFRQTDLEQALKSIL